MFDVKLPLPVPLVVTASLMVGEDDVDQQTPLAVTGPPPLSEILPPDAAEVDVTEVIAVVVRVGTATCAVVKDNSLP